MRYLTALAAAAMVPLAVACGSSSPGTAAAAGSSASPASCHAQFETWQNGPAKAAWSRVVAELRAGQAAGSAAPIPHLVREIKAAGHGASALPAYPMPRCADPHHYWPAILTQIRSAADNAGTGSGGLVALLMAMRPLHQVVPLAQKLHAELKQNAGVSSFRL
jgi:hypothetical protein